MERTLIKTDEKKNFLEGNMLSSTLIFNLILAILYFIALLFWSPQGNKIMFWVLIAGQLYYLWQLITYLYTVWDTNHAARHDSSYKPAVDVFITVAGEPVDIVEETVRAAKSMDYPNFRVYILNDGLVAKKDNWRDMEILAEHVGVECITRTVPGGAKAGNINNAMSKTRSPFVVIFDADHVPHKDFLQKTMGYFVDPKMGFVQSPQFYKNFAVNEITGGAWEQQALFFGPICRGKNRLNAVTMCGTNMVLRREALQEVGGICEESIAEDFVTGMFLHQRGWKSFYVSEVLAEGLAPEDLLSYCKQQFRWARGAMDVIFRYNFLFKRGLTLAQKIQYLSSVSFFFSGVIVAMNALIPIVFFYTGIVPLEVSTMVLAALFLPYILVTIYVLQSSANFTYSFRSLAFSMAGFNIHIRAIAAALLRQKSAFSVTAKRKQDGNFIRLVIPHITYVLLVLAGIVVATVREGLSPSVITDFAWALLNTAIFSEFIRVALPQKFFERREQTMNVSGQKVSEQFVPNN